MGHKIKERRALIGKIEAAYATDPVPTGAANAIYCYDMNLTPMELVKAERNPVRPFFGPDQTIVAGTPVKLDFYCEAAGAGAAGTAPAYGFLLRSCAASETIVALTDVTYKPVSVIADSCTLYANIDGIQHKITGARGDATLEFNHGEIPKVKFSFTGIYNAPTDVALPALTFTPWQKGLIVNKVNTTPFTVHTVSAVLRKLSMAMGNKVGWDDSPNNLEEVRITDQKPAGSISLEMDTLAFKDWFAAAKAGTAGALSLTHGPAGNKVKLDYTSMQLLDPKYEEADGIILLTSAYSLFPSSAGNDAWALKVL